MVNKKNPKNYKLSQEKFFLNKISLNMIAFSFTKIITKSFMRNDFEEEISFSRKKNLK